MDLSNIPQYIQVVLGIGLIIFVHESGHFLAARWCKVRVHVFSLGFGPVLWSRKRGHTTFQIAAIPLGGYVRMAGDESMGASGAEPQPWELGGKSVPQRFLIYSGGVLMNVLFAIIVFPILFLVGIPSFEPIIGEVTPGSPAWYAGLEPGTRVVSVNDRDVYDITQLDPEVAYGGRDEVELVVLEPGSEVPRTLHIEPEHDERMGLYSIGRVAPSLAAGLPLKVEPESPADEAGVQEGDQLLGVVGYSSSLAPERQFVQAALNGGPVDFRLQRGDEQLVVHVTPRLEELSDRPLMGVTPLSNLLGGLRASELSEATDLAAQDRVQAIDGMPVYARRDALVALLASEGEVEWSVVRDDRSITLSSPALSEDQAVALFDDLHFENDMLGTGVVITPRSAAELAGFRSGDRIDMIDGVAIREYDDIRSAAVRAGREKRPLHVEFTRFGVEGSESMKLSVQPRPIEQPSFGLALERARYDYRVTSGVKAITLGVTSSVNMLRDVGRTLRGIMNREVSEDNLGGIITIGVVAKHSADNGLVKFFWFLCLLSINLAFLNVLPIPLLDGGHLFFLLVEGIKGSPVSEKILSYSQLVGLVLIVSIFVFVMYNDLSLHVFN